MAKKTTPAKKSTAAKKAAPRKKAAPKKAAPKKAAAKKSPAKKTAAKKSTTKKSSTPGPKGQNKIHKVMKEMKEGTLRSSSGDKVKSRKQAVAIALSEARAAGAKIPKKKSSSK